MSVNLHKRLVSVTDYHRMAQAGILTEEDRVELINGEIINMSPIGNKHAMCVSRINLLFVHRLLGKDFVNVQNPIQLSDFSEPEPDVVLLKGPFSRYDDRKPNASDVHILVEVADTTLETDRKIKLPLYAEAGVPYVWIVSLPDQQIEVYTRPDRDTYLETKIYRRGSAIESPTLTAAVPVKDILG